MTQYPDLFAALAAPFEPGEIRERTQAGRSLKYITARTAMNRLDDVLGPENWWDHYDAGENSVRCALTIRLPDGQVIAKEDAGGYAGMADSGDDDKSGFSDAFKRTAVKFGIGRYLYRDGVPHFVREREPALPHAEPELPSQARPAPTDGQHSRDHQQGGERKQYGEPKTGRALFAHVKELEQKHDVGFLKYLNSWAKLQDFPGRMVDWDAGQVALAVVEVNRKLQSLNGAPGDAYEAALSN